MSVEYGWLGQLNKRNSIISHGVSGTNTSRLIKNRLVSYGVRSYNPPDIQFKNLVAKDDTVYYILSIAKGKNIWAVHRLVGQLKKGYIVFTQDIDDEDGERQANLWIIPINKLNEQFGKEIRLQTRKGEADYYSVTPKIITKILGAPTKVKLSEIPNKIPGVVTEEK